MGITLYLLPLLLSGATTLGLGLYSRRYRGGLAVGPFGIAMVLSSLWALTYAWEISSGSLDGKVTAASVRLSALVFLPAVWLSAAVEYAGLARLRTRVRVALLLVVPVMSSVLILTSRLHHLFRYNYHLASAGPVVTLAFSVGPWWWVHVTYCFVVSIAALSFYVRSLRIAPSVQRDQVLMIAVGVLIPPLADGLYQMGLSPISGYNLAPSSLLLSSLLIGIALLRHRLFDIGPIARSTIIDELRDPVFVLNAGRRIVDLNPAAASVLTLRGVRAIGLTGGEALECWPALESCIDRTAAAPSEIRIGVGEAARLYEPCVSSVRDRRGRLAGHVILLRDVTERRRADAVSRQLAAIVESSDDAIIAERFDGLIESWNAGAERMYGYSASEMVGASATVLFPPDRSGELEHLLARVRRAERVSAFETIRVRKDGRRVDVSLTMSPIQDSQGRVVGAATIARDVTARKDAEREREQMIGELQQALSSVKTLRGLIPICASCKRIRDDKGYWTQVEQYVRDHSDAVFTHALCPECMSRFSHEIEG